MLAPTPMLRPSPLDISGLFAGTVEALKRRFGLFVLITLIPSVVALVVIGAGAAIVVTSAVMAGTGARNLSTGVLVGIVVLILGVLATVLAQVKAQGMTALAAYEVAQGQRPDVRGLLTRTRGFLPRMAPVIAIFLGAIALVYGLVFAIAIAMVGALDGSSGGRAAGVAALLVLLIIALIPLALFLQVKLLYTIPAVALEQVGGINGMKRSWQLTRGAFWRTLGYYLLAYLAVAAVGYVVSMVVQAILLPTMVAVDGSRDPGAILAALAVGAPLYLLAFVLQLAVQLVTQPFLHTYATYMFIDQVRRSEMAPGPQGYGPPPGPQGGYYMPPGQYYGRPGTGYPPPPPPPPGQPGGWQAPPPGGQWPPRGPSGPS